MAGEGGSQNPPDSYNSKRGYETRTYWSLARRSREMKQHQEHHRLVSRPEKHGGRRRLWMGLLLLLVVGAVVGLMIWYALLPASAELRQIFASRESLRAFLVSFGWWAPVIFFLLQVVQVIFSPIPGNVTTLAGGAIFGLAAGFILSGAGILIGSLLAFFLARLFGQRAVILLVGEKHFARYNRLVAGRGGIGLALLFLLPFFPDDLLCLLAGLSALPARLFLLFLIIGRLPMTFLATLLGAGLLSFSLWQWSAIGMLVLVILFVFFKYGERIERRLTRRDEARPLP